MTAPDKIYLREATRLIDVWFQKPSELAHNYEYIRKVTLLKWAKKEQSESATILADDWWQKVIDKINSL